MIINDTYTIRIISSDNPSNFITTVEIADTTLCEVSHDGYSITINTKELLGETILTVRDLEGKGYEIPIIVDSINYSYEILYQGMKVDENNPAIIYFNTSDTVEQFKVVEKEYSTLFDRYLTEEEGFSRPFSTNFKYEKKDDGIRLSYDNHIIQVNMLSAFSETNSIVTFTASDTTEYIVNLPIYVIDGDLLGTFPSGVLTLHEKNTTPRDIIITGTDSPLTITGNAVGFSYENINDKIIRVLPLGPNKIGSRLDIESFFNGNLKTSYKQINVIPFPLTTNSNTKIAEVGKPHKFLVEHVISTLTLEGNGDTVGKFNYTVDYNRDNYTAQVTLTPTDIMTDAGTITIIDTVEGRVPRTDTVNIKFVVDLDLTVIVDNVKALDVPLKVRFEHATGALKFMAVSRLTGYSIRTNFEYDINPYNGEVSKTAGYLYIHPITKGTIVLRVADTRSFEDVELVSQASGIDFSKWVTVIPTAPNQQDLSNNLTSPADYSDTRLKAGDFVGNTWVEGFKYGISQVKKITYKVSPPDSIKDNAEESLTWMRNLLGATHTLNISIRDGFILEDINKNFSVPATHVSDNIFETADISELAIITTDAQTVLIADTTDRISVTNSVNNTGVIIYNENSVEAVTSRIDFEPVSFLEMRSIVATKKIPMNKPSNCYDIKRMDSSVVDGEFKIFPSTKTDDSIDVLCEFGVDSSGANDIWTIIPEKSIRNFAEIVGKVVGEGNVELDIVSNGGIHPEFYPSALNSNNSLSYLFLELPYDIKSFGYTLDTREVDENSAGTFKILTDTSDIFHINGTANANSMLTRQGSTITYNHDLVAKNLGQVTSLPAGFEEYEHIENADGGMITTDVPSDRIIIMNSGSADTFTLAETFVKELRFKSIYNPSNVATEYWVDGSSSGIDFINIVTLSVNPEGRWIISAKVSNTFDIPQKVTLLADTTWLISNVSSEIIEMGEFVKVMPIDTVYNISDRQTTLIDLSEFVKVNPDRVNYIISDDNVDTIEAVTDTTLYPKDFVANISHRDDTIVQFETNDDTARGNIVEDFVTDYHLYNISLNDSLSNITELDTNSITAGLNVREIVKTLPHALNISFVDDSVVELTANRMVAVSNIRTGLDIIEHKYNISDKQSGLLDLAEYVRLNVYEHDKVVSVVIEDETVSNVTYTLSLSADIKEIVTDMDSYTFNIEEFVTLTPNTPHDLVVSYLDNEILEIPTRSHFDSYHPVNRLWRDATPMDISENDTRHYSSQDRSDIINPTDYPVIELSSNVTGNLLAEGHNPKHPAYIFQDGVVADNYTDSTTIDFINLDYNGLETDIITQNNETESTNIDFFNTEFVQVENDVVTQGNYDTVSLVDMRNLIYTGSETDIISQDFNFEGIQSNLIKASTVRLFNINSVDVATIEQPTTRNLDILDTKFEVVQTTQENPDFLLEYKDINNSWVEIPLISPAETVCDYFIAPDGNDNNLGTYESPFKTPKNVPNGSKIMLKNGLYNKIVNHSWYSPNNYYYYSVIDAVDTSGKSDLTFIGESKNGVILHRGWIASCRDFPVIAGGTNIHLTHVTVEKPFSGGNYTGAISRYSSGAIFQDVTFNMVGGYAYNYGYYTKFANCNIIGGNLLPNYNSSYALYANNILSNLKITNDYDTVSINNNILELRANNGASVSATITEMQPAIGINMLNMELITTENDIIEQQNFDTVMTISFTNLHYTGLETDISSQKQSDNIAINNLVNMSFDGEPNANIAVQYKSKAFMIDANPTIVTDERDSTFITTQKGKSIMAIGEQSLTVRDNTNIVTQKASSFIGELGDTLRLHLPTEYKTDTVVEVTVNELSSEDNTASIVYTFSEENIRETEVLDFTITGEVDNVSINTYKGSNIEAVETVSVV